MTPADAKKIHSLADVNEKGGKIRFIHFRDGKENSFTSVVNIMSGSRLSYFNNEAPSVDDPVAWVKSVFKGIRKKSTKVIEVIGDF
jgi:hypothetical protein